VTNFLKSVKIRQNYDHESVAPLFLAHPVYQSQETRSNPGMSRRHTSCDDDDDDDGCGVNEP